jgi:glycosyltransferase involved in cell wall biosynthesis
MDRADVVFTGGFSLWEAKRALHRNTHPFPSSVDVAHFATARGGLPEPDALRGIPRPRLVYAGVIDERLDLGLVARLGEAGVGEVVLVGPIVKIDPADVPTGPHVHQVGMQPYAALPAFFANADVGIMPFALNEATRYISPTKTPEYLAAGLPVVSTPIRDVIRGYGDLEAVHIGDGADAFADAVRDALASPVRGRDVEERLATMSWDRTWDEMEVLVAAAAGDRAAA